MTKPLTLTRFGVLYRFKTTAQLLAWLRILTQPEARTVTVTPSQGATLNALHVNHSYAVPLIVLAA